MNITIIGHGYVGAPLADLLSKEHTVTTISRSPSTKKHTHITADAHKIPPHHWPEADILIHTLPPDKGPVEMYAQNVARILSCHESHHYRPSHVIFISSCGIYDQDLPHITEDTPINPNSERAQRLARAEEAVRESSLPYTIIRPSRIYGPGRDGLLKNLSHGRPCLSHKDHTSHHIHVDDLVRIIAFIMEHPNPRHIYIASDPEPEKTNTIVHWLSAKTGIPLSTDNISDSLKNRARHIMPEALLEQNFVFQYPNYISGYTDILSRKTIG